MPTYQDLFYTSERFISEDAVHTATDRLIIGEVPLTYTLPPDPTNASPSATGLDLDFFCAISNVGGPMTIDGNGKTIQFKGQIVQSLVLQMGYGVKMHWSQNHNCWIVIASTA